MTNTAIVTGNRALAAHPGDEMAETLASVLALPPSRVELGLHLLLDRAAQMSEEDPLGGLDAYVGLMHRLALELSKYYGATALDDAERATVALNSGVRGDGDGVSKAAVRCLGALAKTTGIAVKLGAARVRIRDEMAARQRRSMGPADPGDDGGTAWAAQEIDCAGRCG